MEIRKGLIFTLIFASIVGMNNGQMDEAMKELLRSVSRSFYLSMVFLPPAMRRGIALAYMLARATDSVADSNEAVETERLAVLRLMAQAIAGQLNAQQEAQLQEELTEHFASAQAHEGEATLLRRFQDCLELLRQMPEGEAALMRQVLATICDGQCWDLEFFAQHQGVQNEQETRRYIYMVAGCVGEFWTRLGLCTMGAKFCPPEREELMQEAGIRYGCGLQLVNILRDVHEDAARGRCYLPEGDRHEVWMARAEKYLKDGLDYSKRLGGLRLRFTAMLPALLGLKTLALLRKQGHNNQRKAKIKRSSVYLSMLQALGLSLFSARPSNV